MLQKIDVSARGQLHTKNKNNNKNCQRGFYASHDLFVVATLLLCICGLLHMCFVTRHSKQIFAKCYGFLLSIAILRQPLRTWKPDML